MKVGTAASPLDKLVTLTRAGYGPTCLNSTPQIRSAHAQTTEQKRPFQRLALPIWDSLENRFFKIQARGRCAVWVLWMLGQTRSGWWCLTARHAPLPIFTTKKSCAPWGGHGRYRPSVPRRARARVIRAQVLKTGRRHGPVRTDRCRHRRCARCIDGRDFCEEVRARPA